MMMNESQIDQGWRLLDHTADIRMEVYGATLKDLFINASSGLTSLLASGSRVVPNVELDVALETVGPEELLVDWLREILFQHQTKRFVLVRADIVALSDSALRARLVGGTRSLEEEPDIEIKGVTYHGLAIRRNDHGYSARIVLDI